MSKEKVGEAPILVDHIRYQHRSSDCIGRSFLQILEAKQSLYRFKITIFIVVKLVHRKNYFASVS